MAAVSIPIWKDCLWAELFDDRSGDGRPVSIIHVDDAMFARASIHGGLALSEMEARHAFLSAFTDRSGGRVDR